MFMRIFLFLILEMLGMKVVQKGSWPDSQKM